MASFNESIQAEQLCYIPCNFCNIILAVSVPKSSFDETVTVRCGHCANLWSANMAATLPSLMWQQPNQQQQHHDHQDNHLFHLQKPSIPKPDYRMNLGSTSVYCKMAVRGPSTPNIDDRTITKRPLEKRQRVPSAYNQFIKTEIQRIKANNPDISHKEAFSTAAKNWARYPHIQFGLTLESSNQAMIANQESEKPLMAKAAFI